MYRMMTISWVCLLVVSLYAGAPPNVIVIMADDMGYGGLSCYDNPNFRTPEIDRLASEGLRLTDYHSNGSVCSPTRAALMTGRYQYRSGCHVVINASPEHPDHVRGLQPEEWTFAEAMKLGGYATAVYGKWHLGYDPKFNPVHNGFDEFKGFVSGNIDAQSHYDRMETFDWWHNTHLTNEPGYHTDLITEHTLDFIERHKDRPFFIYAAHGTPHDPHQARGSKIVRGPKKGLVPEWGVGEPAYSNEPGEETWLIRHFILPLDEGVGRIRQKIVDLGLEENTIIWFVSDNGGTKGNHTTSPQTRGNKGSVYEGGHRVPGIVWAPGRIKPGSSSELVTSMDIMPTSMALADIKSPANHHLDGINVAPLLFEGRPLPERHVIWGREKNNLAIRRGPWKLIKDELYNLNADSRETKDLASKYPEIVKELAQKRDAMFKEAISDSPYDEE